MRKLWPVALGVFLLTAAILFVASWLMQGWQIRRTVEGVIAQLNRESPFITYQSLELTGFPREVAVRIVQPKVTLANLHIPTAQGAAPPWNVQAEWSGAVEIAVNIFSNRLTVRSVGPIHLLNTLGDRRDGSTTQASGPLICQLQLAREGNFLTQLWSLDQFAQRPAVIVQRFRALDCTIPPYVATDDASKEELTRSGGTTIALTTEITGSGRRAYGVSLHVKDLLYTERFGQLVNAYYASLPGLNGAFSVRDWSAYGTQNMTMEGSYDGPESLSALTLGSDFTFNLRDLTFSNALYSYKASAHLGNRPDGSRFRLAVKAAAGANFTPAFDRQLQALLRAALEQGQSVQDPLALSLLQNRSINQAMDIAAPIVFRPSEFSPLTLAVDLESHGEQSNPRMSEVTLTQADLQLQPYGLSLNGLINGTQQAQQMFPPGSRLNLACRNCFRLLDDATAYAQRVTQVIAALDPASAPEQPVLPPALTEGIKQFMGALATPAADAASGQPVHRFEVVGDAAGNAIINGKDMNTVLQLYGQYVVPHLPKAEPPPAQ